MNELVLRGGRPALTVSRQAYAFWQGGRFLGVTCNGQAANVRKELFAGAERLNVHSNLNG